jgi:AcrR family transcriptional regulator
MTIGHGSRDVGGDPVPLTGCGVRVPSRTWERLPPAKRAAVEAAAQAEFAERGFSGGSLNVIAREAGVAKGSLFQYFADKLDLYAYIAEQASARIRAEMERRLAALDPDQRPLFAVLGNLIGQWVEYFDHHPVERALTAAVNLEGDAAARQTVRAVANAHYLAVLRPLLESALKRGDIRPDADVEAFLALLLLLMPHLALAPHVRGLDPVLGLYGASERDTAAVATRLVRVFAAAFGPA